MIRKFDILADGEILNEISDNLYCDKYNTAFFHSDYADKYLDDLNIDEGIVTHLSFKDDELLGCISYYVDETSQIIYAMLILSFEETNVTFGRDVFRSVEEIAKSDEYFKITFSAESSNPFAKTYEKLIHKYGGRTVGTFRNNIYDGNRYHDEIFFEIECADIRKHIKGE